MRLIDIDKVKSIESHIHYIKNYKARAVLMDLKSKIHKYDIEFSIEHHPLEPIKIKINFLENPHFPIIGLIKKIKIKINDLNDKGSLVSAH